MPPYVIVSFDPQTEFRFPLDAGALVGGASEGARRWFEREYSALGVEPGSPLGKVLVIDKILSVARFSGEQRFAGNADWARQYARHAAHILGRDRVRVDVGNASIGF